MTELDVALALAGALGSLLAYRLGRLHRFPLAVPKLFPQWLEKGGLHEHRFDTMLGDGSGWRCGICGKPREETRPAK